MVTRIINVIFNDIVENRTGLIKQILALRAQMLQGNLFSGILIFVNQYKQSLKTGMIGNS